MITALDVIADENGLMMRTGVSGPALRTCPHKRRGTAAPESASLPMKRAVAMLTAASAIAVCPSPGVADQEMVQSPLLMRRAGPSCQPGNLEGDPRAGYRYYLGPCAGPDATSDTRSVEQRRRRGRQ
jgi:hypothetical protein